MIEWCLVSKNPLPQKKTKFDIFNPQLGTI